MVDTRRDEPTNAELADMIASTNEKLDRTIGAIGKLADEVQVTRRESRQAHEKADQALGAVDALEGRVLATVAQVDQKAVRLEASQATQTGMLQNIRDTQIIRETRDKVAREQAAKRQKEDDDKLDRWLKRVTLAVTAGGALVAVIMWALSHVHL